MQGCKNARLQGPVLTGSLVGANPAFTASKPRVYCRVAEGKGVIMLFSEIVNGLGCFRTQSNVKISDSYNNIWKQKYIVL